MPLDLDPRVGRRFCDQNTRNMVLALYLGKSALIRGGLREKRHDVVGEYAVYMMDLGSPKPPEPAAKRAVLAAPTLTPRRSPPIRPRFLKWT